MTGVTRWDPCAVYILRRGMLFVLMRKESFGEKVAVYIVQDDHALG